MPRVKRGFKARQRRKKVLKAAKGYRGGLSKQYKTASIAVMRAGMYAYRDRKNKKRNFRRLWITRINAACRQFGVSYSVFMHKLSEKNIDLDRKILADLAVRNPEAFEKLVKEVTA